MSLHSLTLLILILCKKKTLINQNQFSFFVLQPCSSVVKQYLKLLEDKKYALTLLGISASKITKGNKIYITKKSELRKFLKLISFRNDKHLKKIKMWNLNSPVV